MQSSQISQEAALRISIASRMLPNIELSSLLGLLIQHLGEPLTEAKLVGLSPKAFRVMVSSLGEGPSRKEVTNALAALTNPEMSDVDAPVVSSLPSLTGPKLKVAITSNQGEMINGHYGSCMRVLIYEVNQETYRLIDVRDVQSTLQGEERAIYMVNLIRDCQILFTLSIGGPAAARVTRAGVHPIKKATPMSAEHALTELATVLNYNAPPWIRKFMGLEPKQKDLVEVEC